MKKLPPLNALRAFEATARNLSVTRAAEELHVTHAAISQQIKLLEGYLNVPLFVREGKRLNLTAEGKDYALALAAAFTHINQATEHLLKQDDPHVLTVCIPPTLALRWFIPRLLHFQDVHSDLEIRLSTTQREVNFNQQDIDLAIYYGNGNWPGLYRDFLFEDYLFPVCSPKLLDEKKSLNLQKNKFIYVTAELRKQDWPIWLSAANMTEPPESSKLYFQDTIQALHAAHAGLGIAMTHSPFVIEDIQLGQLIAPFKVKVKLPANYYLVCPKSYLLKAKIKKFRNWLLKEAKLGR